jgi:ketosteroid isomerase-like protein
MAFGRAAQFPRASGWRLMSLPLTFDAFVKALNSSDQSTLEAVMSDQFRFTNAFANMVGKATRLETILENPELFRSLQYDEIEFEISNDTGLVLAAYLHQGSKSNEVQFGRSTFVFAKQAEQWRLVAQHNSHVQDDGG